MRRLASILVPLLLLGLPAWALARPLPDGSPGSLSIRNGKAEVVLQVHGAVIGRVASGTLKLTDGDPYDEQVPNVNLHGRHKPKPVSDATTVYRGRGIRFRVTQGTYRLKFDGKGIFLSAVGHGWVILDGDESYQNTGVYSLNGDPYQPIPYERTDRLKLVAPEGQVGAGQRP